MPKKRRLDPILGFVYLLIGIAKAVDITLEHPYDGFFLRETYNKNEIPDENKVSKTFIINQASDLYKIKAENGPYESQQTISRNLLEAVYTRNRNNNSLMHRSIVYNMDVSAHVVSKDISPKLPQLQVLVHAHPHTKSQTSNSGQYWCVQVFVEASGEEFSSVCILNEKDKVCVAGLDLHKEWWTGNGTLAKVSYSFTGIDYNDQCASASNAIIPVKTRANQTENGIIKQEIAVLNLVQNEKSFDEWKDQDILIDVPREMFHQGDSFEIPIRLEKNSDLQVFVMRARVRQGLRITGARMTDPSSQWSIHVDIKEHQKTGTVTAFVKDAKVYENPKSVLDVFQWQMEVAEETYDTRDMGRVVWSIEYQLNGVASENYPSSQDSKIVSQINIRSKDQQRLVPVLKVNEIVNVAILTGSEQIYPLSIYAVDDRDRYEDVTYRTKCHSVEVDVLKVASDCSSVSVDGKESRGSHNVSIIAKYGHTTAFMDIKVWVPEDRLSIQLSDTKLSRVRNWKVQIAGLKRSKRSLNPYYDKKYVMPKGRSCELRRQQCVVDVFTRFYIQTPKQTDFYMGPAAYLRVTDLVKNRLRMSDPRVATLHDNMIKGREEGRTEIQLLSPRNGHVLAAREIQVSHDKVSIVKLNLKLVTGMTVFVEPSTDVDGALVAIAYIDSKLRSNFQEGIVEVELVYSDKTTLPLRYIESEDYFLKASTLDNNVIGVVPSKQQFQPHIVATGEGKGDFLQLSLELGKFCQRKKSKPILTDTMIVEVDYSQKPDVYQDRLMNDAKYDTNRASDRWDGSSKKDYILKIPSHYEDIDSKSGKFSGKGDLDKNNVKVIIKDDFDSLVEKAGAAKQEPLRTKTTTQGLTPLEIGMYVLLAVFCVAMTVFMVNCIVFFVRYKRKQKPQKAKNEAISNANDWVWIGRATLERNSVYTRSSRTLMPEEDFNGNLNNSRPLSTGSSCGSSTTGPPSAPNSNRNSTVSTYKGSECSIRITANPLTDEGGAGAMGGALPEETRSEGGVPQWDYEAMGMNYNQLLEYFDNLKESNA